MDNKSDGVVVDEVEERLEDLFREDNGSMEFLDDNGTIEDTSLRGLKAIILSIDWEITDEMMTRLIEQIDRLKKMYKDDKVLVLFLQLLDSVGRYIKANKASSHPDATKTLNSVYNRLEKVVLSKDMIESERKKILLAEINRFKRLKEDIALRKARLIKEEKAKAQKETSAIVEEKERYAAIQEPGRPSDETSEESLSSDMSQIPPHEAFTYALEEIKHVIKAEFRALKAELKLWREMQ